MKTFTTECTKIAKKIKPHNVWEIWTDITKWPTWDQGLESCTLQGKFTAGSKMKLIIQGGQEVETLLKDVQENQGFSDITQLPFGQIETDHRLEETTDGVKITHSITAKIEPEQASFFEEHIWKDMIKGLPHAVEALAIKAEEMAQK